VPMVHACAYPDCDVLTMGRFCLDHERQRRRRRRLPVARVAQGSVLIAAGIAGAVLRTRLGR